MTLDELKEHCLKTLKHTEKFPTKTFEEHTLVLRLIENQTSAIEELEKIKADFEEIKGPRDNPYNNKTEYSVSMKELREVFDNHIAELKGENKQSRCNSCQNNTGELSGECYECVKGIEDWYEPISELKGENK